MDKCFNGRQSLSEEVCIVPWEDEYNYTVM